jgi:hypothetical protein
MKSIGRNETAALMNESFHLVFFIRPSVFALIVDRPSFCRSLHQNGNCVGDFPTRLTINAARNATVLYGAKVKMRSPRRSSCLPTTMAVTALLQRDGLRVGKDRVEPIWRCDGMKVPQKQKRRGRLWLNDGSCARLRPERAQHVWSYDFVSVQTRDGRSVRILNPIDE